MLRVIAGLAKGTLLKVPEGGVTRPATDLVRGAMFSILENMTNDWDTVLDLFSGSGAIGIEALSRGAGWVDFVDRDPKVCAIIKENIAKAKFTEQSHLYCKDAGKAAEFLTRSYDIIIMDPPYANDAIDDIVLRVANSTLVKDNTVVVVTHTKHRVLKESYGPLTLVKERRHGDSIINLYRKGG